MHRDVRAGGGAPHRGVVGRLVPLVIGLLVSALAATAASGTATATTAPLVANARLNVYDAAHTGYRAADFVSRPVARGEYPRVLAGYRRTEPDLVWINLGANDYLNGGGTPAAVAAELTRLVDDLRALPTRPSIVLGVPHRLVGHESPGRTWAQYAAAIQGVAAARGTGLIRLSDVIPTAGSGSPLLSADGLHLSNAGQAAVADLVSDHLTRTLVERPAWAGAWLTAATGPRADVLAIGDSLTEGQGATTRANRWLDRFSARFRAEHRLPSGGTYVPAWYAVYAPDSPWGTPYAVNAGTATKRSWAPGLGLRSLEVRSGAVTYGGLRGTTAEIWLTPGSTTTVTTRVDGGAAVTRTVVPWAFQKLTVPLGALGTHALRVATPSGGSLVLAGLVVRAG